MTYEQKYELPKALRLAGSSGVYDGNLSLIGCELTELPDLSGLHLTGSFFCSRNPLTSLKGCPRSVDGMFMCHDTGIRTLEGAPEIVGGTLSVGGAHLTSLRGCPRQVGMREWLKKDKSNKPYFYVSKSPLRSLDGLPEPDQMKVDKVNIVGFTAEEIKNSYRSAGGLAEAIQSLLA